MSPFNTSRREARARSVRALFGATGLCAIAVAVGAATTVGPLTSAASSKMTPSGPPAGSAAPAQTPAVVDTPPPAPAAETPPPAPVAETPPAPVTESPPPAPAHAVEQSKPAPVVEQVDDPVQARPEQPAEAPADEPAAADDPGREPADASSRESADASGRGADGPRGQGSQDPPGRGSDDGRRRELEDPAGRASADERDGGSAWDRGPGPVEYGGREPEDAAAKDADEAPRYDPQANPGAWGAFRRLANLTGAIGGEKETPTVRVPGLASVPPIAVVLPELPIADQTPAPVGEPSEPPSDAGPSSPAPPSTDPSADDLGREPGQPEQRGQLGAPVGTGGGDGAGGTGGTTQGGAGDIADTAADGAAPAVPDGGFIPAPAAGADFFDAVGQAEGGGDGGANPTDERDPRDEPGDGVDQVIRPIERIATSVPDSLWFALAALGVLALLLGLGYLFATLRARSLARQRRELLQEVGLLQSALLPPVPEKLGALRTSVAYRPADGPGAGGDFYDVLPLTGGRVGFILGDVSGHGRGALARTAFMRYTLRAYLEAGLEPRVALQVAGRVIDENLGGDFATVLLAVHDPETGSLTYATAGHPAPIVVGPHAHHPVTAGSSPPIGVGVPTGLRQTTVPLVPGSVAALFTDGLMDARADGGILGRERLEHMLEELGDDASARALIDRVAKEARVLSDDIAAVVVSPTNGTAAVSPRTEQLELSTRELHGPLARRFLAACGVPQAEAVSAVAEARSVAAPVGGAVLNVTIGDPSRVDVLPRDVEGIEAASRRASPR